MSVSVTLRVIVVPLTVVPTKPVPVPVIVKDPVLVIGVPTALEESVNVIDVTGWPHVPSPFK